MSGPLYPGSTCAGVSKVTLRQRITLVLVVVWLVGCGGNYTRYERAGFGISEQADPQTWAKRLGAGWFLDWNMRDWSRARRLEYWQTIRLSKESPHPALGEIAELVRRNRGSVWIIGNEPDNRLQDAITPVDYAVFYHDYYFEIKQADPGAKVAVGGVTAPSRLRVAYLDQVLLEYERRYGGPLPCDWWTVHGYALREQVDSWGAGIPPGVDAQSGLLIEPDQHGDLELFKSQISQFREWLKNRGYQGTPLALTEYGILLPSEFGYTPEVVGKYLEDTFHWLDSAVDPAIGYPEDGYRLVQRWAWFSLSDDQFPVANLADLEEDRLTLAGLAFREFIEGKTQP